MLYDCETWSLTLTEERRQWVFENIIMRRIFGLKRDENREWRMLHNEGLHSLYRSPNIDGVIKSRSLKWTWHVGIMEEGRSVFTILTGKPTGNRRLGRSRHRWEGNVRMNIEEIGGINYLNLRLDTDRLNQECLNSILVNLKSGQTGR